MRRSSFRWLILFLLLVAGGIRLWDIGEMPPGLARDEALNADIVEKIWAREHALFFREGFGHEPLYHYFSAPFQKLIGDNALAVRLPSAFLGVVLVALVWAWVKRDWGEMPAFITSLLLTLSWWSIIFSRVWLRPILEPVLLVLAAWHWHKRPWLAGVWLGLAIYSYTAARAIYLLPLLYLVYLWSFAWFSGRRQGTKFLRRNFVPDLRGTATILGVCLFLYLPLAWTLRADPSLQERVNQLRGPLDALAEGDFQPVWETIVATLGVFSVQGDPLWSYGLPEQPLFTPILAIFFYGGVGLCLVRMFNFRWKTGHFSEEMSSLGGRQTKYGFVLIWLGVTLMPSAAAPDAPSLVRLIGAMPVVYLMPALFLHYLTQKLKPYLSPHLFRVGTATAIALIALFTAQHSWVTGQAWVAAPETRQKYQEIWLDMSHHWREQNGEALVVADTWYEPVKGDSLDRNYGQKMPARWVQQGLAFVYPAEAPALAYLPDHARLVPALADIVQLESPLYESETLLPYGVWEMPAFPPTLQHTLHQPFTLPQTNQPILTLLAHQTDSNTNDFVTLWQVNAPLPPDLAIFVHARDQNGDMLAQHDGLDAIATTLRVGDRFLQWHPLSVMPAQYQLGLYQRQSQQRLQPVGLPADIVIILP